MRAEQEREYVEFVRARAVTLRRVAYRLCGDWHGAQDLVQRAFVLLYRHWRQASAAASLDAYVRKMLLNVYLEDRRGWWSQRVTPSAEPLVESGLVDAGAEGRVDLMAALARISPGQRAVLVLRYWEGLDVTETAETLGCSPGTVKSQTSLAIAALRRLLPDYLPDGRAQRPANREHRRRRHPGTRPRRRSRRDAVASPRARPDAHRADHSKPAGDLPRAVHLHVEGGRRPSRTSDSAL